MDSLPITRYWLHGAEKPPQATICIVGGTNVAHALAISPPRLSRFYLGDTIGPVSHDLLRRIQRCAFFTLRVHPDFD
jgi:hypothetical protein